MKPYIDVFILGVVMSWGACLAFCAPILLAYIGATQRTWPGGLKVSLAFSLGRMISYVILSIVSCGLGTYLIQRFYQHQGLVIYLLAGIFISLLGIIVLKKNFLSSCVCPAWAMAGEKNIGKMIFLGVVIGVSPCLPLFGLLTYIAMAAQNLFSGALLGFVFGLGTLLSPLLLFGPLTSVAAKVLAKKALAEKIFNWISGLFLVYLGSGLIIRALLK